MSNKNTVTLRGSCHCGKVRFSLESAQPWPYMRCYCSICRKTGGGGGYMINLGGIAASLQVQGRQHVKVYQAMTEKDGRQVRSEHQRHFCGECGSHLWAHNSDWPELVHPVASAIDTELPTPPAHVHIMLKSAASWAKAAAHIDKQDECFDRYPDTSLADWHTRHEFKPSG